MYQSNKWQGLVVDNSRTGSVFANQQGLHWSLNTFDEVKI